MTRQAVLSNIARRLGVEPGEQHRRSVVREHLEHPHNNTVPARAKVSGQALIDQFSEMLTRVQGTTAEVRSVADVPAAVLSYLNSSGQTLCLSGQVHHLGLPWREQGFNLVDWAPRTSYDVCVSLGMGGAAETGTIVIGSTSDAPLTQNFLGDTHIVLLYKRDVFGAYEEVLQRVRASGMPRHLTFVSGPSCTADIEMTLEYGVHGPRRLHVLLLDE